ncbi:MAG: universal stress protein [Planctomycetes bacterium]|nr:universal stress protein [Planctomycetota bacterium]
MVAPVVKRILAPVGFDSDRDADLGYAIALAAQLRAELLLLAVIDTSATVTLIGKHRQTQRSAPDFEKALHDEVEGILQQMVDRAAAAGVQALGHLKFSEEVEEQILKEALVQKVDLILVHSHGRSGLMKTLLGSTAGEILKAAPCPVLVSRA